MTPTPDKTDYVLAFIVLVTALGLVAWFAYWFLTYMFEL